MSSHVRPVLVKLAVLSLSFVAAAAAGCGSEDGAAAYFGTTIGATWNYAVTPASRTLAASQ